MPSDSNGVYSLPTGYLATDGETIQASQHNPPLEDVAAALTARLSRNGNAAMTGPLKLSDGSAGAPSLTFGSATNMGFYKTANGFGVSVNGAQVFEFTAVPQGIPVGLIADWPSPSPPNGWLHCRGQSLLRASYPDLFNAIATIFGAVDGTHFSLPDLQCATTVGLDVSRGILAGAGTLGALLGAQSVAIAQANLPNYTLPDTLGVSRTGSVALSAGATNALNSTTGPSANVTGGGGAYNLATITVNDTQSFDVSGSVTSGGSNVPLSVVQPSVPMNKIIFTGVL